MKKTLAPWLMVSAFLFASPTQAAFPVIDYSNLAKLIEQYNQLKKQYSVLQETKDNAIKSLKKATEQVEALTGRYSYGDINHRDKWFPWHEDSNWDDVFNDAYQHNQLQHEELRFDINEQAIARVTGNKDVAAWYGESAKSALAARYSNEQIFNEVAGNIKKQKQLLQEINNTDNIKASIDLLSRLQAENNMMQLEMMQLLASNGIDNSVKSQINSREKLIEASFFQLEK